MHPTSTLIAVLAGLVLSFAGAQAATNDHPHPTGGLGTVHFPISCSAAVQADFDRAVALLHHMTYPQARAAFEQVATVDPECAMARWGIAMTLFQPVWPTRPGPAELERGHREVAEGLRLAPPTERERLFLKATEAFFADPSSGEYWQRLHRWEEAMARVHSTFPEDPEATTFYALAHLAVAPAGEVSLEHAEKAAELLLRVYEAHPDHPGAMHYLVHANDAPGRERDSLEVVRRYEAIAPDNPHALHMPTHIYTRLGDWEAVIRGNLRAAEAALAHPAGEHGELIWDEFPHAIEYLIYAYLQLGADDEAAAAIARLRAKEPLQPTFKTAFHLASTEARYALERHDWGQAAGVVARHDPGLDWDRFRWPEAISWFARGLGAAHQGDASTASLARARLAALEAATAESGEELFARNIRVLGLELEAWIANGEGARARSVDLMRQAADLEVNTPKHPVTPGPTLPAYELLGDLLLAQDRPADAQPAYERSLELYPRRFNSLLGAARAARAVGQSSLAGDRYRELLKATELCTRNEALHEARAYLASLQ